MEAAVNAVNRGKNLTEQTEVDAMVKAIEDAIAALEKNLPIPNREHPIRVRRPVTQATLLLWIALLFVVGGAVTGTTVVSRKKSTTNN